MKNIKKMFLDELDSLNSRIENFNPADYVGFFEFDRYLDKTYKRIIIGGHTIKVSDALFSNFAAYRELFDEWVKTLDKADIKEYNRLLEKRERVINYLEELDNE